MSKKRTVYLILAILFYVCFGLFTWAVMNYDCAAIGPNGSTVGFATLNQSVAASVGVDEVWYELTNVIGWLAVLICAVLGFIGLTQLIKTKSLFKVDIDLICLGIFYILCMVTYAIFLKVTVNYRPVLELDGSLENGYPSSHTILAVCVFASVLIEIKRRIGDRLKALIEEISCMVMIFISVVGRLLSGKHWATDIIASLIISAAFICTLLAMLPERKCKYIY